jgi:hypothetical protein
MYLHNDAATFNGTAPSVDQSTLTETWHISDYTSLRRMDLTAGTVVASISGPAAAGTTLQTGLWGVWVSPPLAAGATISAQAMSWGFVTSQSSTSMVWPASYSVCFYLWRPSTGALVGVMKNQNGIGPVVQSAAGATSTIWTNATTATVSVTALTDDVLVIELWGAHTQTMNGPYTARVDYDGTTAITADGVTNTDARSFVQLNTSTLTFKAWPGAVTFEPAWAIGSNIGVGYAA